jgi:hypothetical protein
MKKLIFLILITFCFSCEKENLHCWRCETIANDEVISAVTTCGMTEYDMVNFQKGLEAESSALLKCEAETK